MLRTHTGRERIFRPDDAEKTLISLLNHPHDIKVPVKFIEEWINSCVTAASAISVYEKVKRMIHDTEISDFDDIFWHTTKLRILFLELGLHENYQNDPIHTEKQTQDIEYFLNTPRTYLYKLVNCFFSTRSKRIYDNIQNGEFDKAKKAYQYEAQCVTEEINTKLCPY